MAELVVPAEPAPLLEVEVALDESAFAGGTAVFAEEV
jgi:hypothetical protein